MPRDRGGIGRTGKKQQKARTLGSSQTSPQVAEAAAGAVAEPCSAAETAEQASLTAMNDDAGCAGQKRVRFEPDPPRPTGIRRTLPVSGPWTWGGRWDFPTDHPMHARNEDGTPREVDLQHKDGKLALKAHRWGLRVAEHVAGGFKSEWPTNNSRWFEDWCERTHRRWCPGRVALPFWARWTRSGAVVYRNAVSSNLTTGVVDGSVRVKCVLKVL